MAKVKLLVDTDIAIDYLNGVKPAKELFRSKDIDIHFSVLTKKELLSKEGLSNSDRQKIKKLMNSVKVFNVDNDIAEKFSQLVKKYGEKRNLSSDYLIAATAYAKKLPLMTRNARHFKKIKEIKLSPVYKI